MEENKIYKEDCLKTMSRMEDNFIDLTITSPPYDDLRSYNNNIDKSWGEHKWKPIIEMLYDKTKDGGIVVWVIGDAVINGSESGSSFRQALYFMEQGFRLHDTMIYEKNGSPFPASRKGTRYSQVFEYMFVFSKGKPTATLLCDKPNKWAGTTSFGQQTIRNKAGEKIKKAPKVIPDFSPRNNIWKYSTGKNYSTKDDVSHPAIFPEKLAGDHILTWSKENDLVYDPFMGSGTTAKMAVLNKRRWIGSEISGKYVKEANNRLQKLHYDFFVQEKAI